MTIFKPPTHPYEQNEHNDLLFCKCGIHKKYHQTRYEQPHYPTYYDTVVSNPAWQEWGKVAQDHGFDWHESVECGWLSPEHFQAFLNWYKNEI